MTKETFLECVNEIDDELIAMNEVKAHKKRSGVIKGIAIAACFAIVFGAGVKVTDTLRKEPESVRVAKNETRQTAKPSVEDKDNVKADAYNGSGTGEFVYNGKKYVLVNNEEYMLMNSIPTQIITSNIGSNLANNISDTSNNMIGNLYEYTNEQGEKMMVVERPDGIYNLAMEKGEDGNDSY